MAHKTETYSAGTGTVQKKKKSRPATLTIVNGCFSGLEIRLRKVKTSLGRDVECDICLDDSLVSNRHAVIERQDSRYEIEDLNSRGGLTLNGDPVHRHALKNGDTIGIGRFELKFSR